MSIADVTEAAVLRLIFNATAWANYADNTLTSPQTQIAVGLHTADPADSGSMLTSEAAYGSYARVNVNRDTGGWTVSGTTPTTVNPVSPITFPGCTSGSSTITNFSTGKTGGGAAAILYSGITVPNVPVSTGIVPQMSTTTALTLD